MRRNSIASCCVFLIGWISQALTASSASDIEIENAKIGYVGKPAIKSSTLIDGAADIFQGSYSSVDWSGDLNAYRMDSSCNIDPNNTQIWRAGSAGSQLNNKNFNSRRIVTSRPISITVNNIVSSMFSGGVPFKWASLTPAQQTELGSEAVLNYIRGNKADELPAKPMGFRARKNILGGIVHSTPLYWKDGVHETVFVGANDGMLHAFNALTGEEQYAIVPGTILSKLPKLTDPAHLNSYFVDSQLTAWRFLSYEGLNDQLTGGGVEQPNTKNVLVAPFGLGGKGLMAINIKGAPPANEADAAQRILWEINNSTSGFENLGHVIGKPLMSRLAFYGYPILMVGNGLFSGGSGKATLYGIIPDIGNKLFEISTPAGSPDSPNGLLGLTAHDSNANGVIDTVYAGDMQGNLWKFDFSKGNSLAGTVTKLYQTSPAQPIVSAPVVQPHPKGGNMILFTTGQPLIPKTQTTLGTHYAYGIWDRPAQYSSNNAILQQTLTEHTAHGKTVRVASNNTPNWNSGASNHKGWRTTLSTSSTNNHGDMVLGESLVINERALLFMSTRPTANNTGTPPGANWWMQLNALTGGEPDSIRFDLNDDQQFSNADLVNNQKVAGLYMGGGVRSQFSSANTKKQSCFIAAYDGNSPATYTTTTETTIIPAPAPTPTPGGGPGVAGGHFDVDIYYGPSLTGPSGNGSQKHTHEYDDAHNVTGVNFLDPSPDKKDSTKFPFNLSNAISPDEPFKVLFQNQYLSPAVQVHLDTAGYQRTSTNGFVPIQQFTPRTLNINALPTYTRASIKSFVVNLPVNAFDIHDWWGGHLGLAADPRVGLHPTVTGCVKEGPNNYFQPVIPPPSGSAGPGVSASKQGVRHNGAFTVHIIKANTPQSALEMVIPGSPEYGWTVKSSEFPSWVLAEYTFFWHEKPCYGESGWTKTRGKESGGGPAGSPPERGSDPTVGGTAGTGTGTGTGPTPTVGTTSTVLANGNIVEIVTTQNADGSFTVKTTTKIKTTPAPIQTIGVGGFVAGNGSISQNAVTTIVPALGRANWRELHR